MRSSVTFFGSTISVERKPPEACQAMWQWKAQTPVVLRVLMLAKLSVCMNRLGGGRGRRQHTRRAVELDHEVAVAAHEVDVPPVRVGRADDGAVPGAGAFVEDVEIMPVEVHRVAVAR